MEKIRQIEQRANEYVGHAIEIDEGVSTYQRRLAYIQGATDQKKIDIEKACMWLKFEGGVKFIDDEIYYHHIDECIENFKKAMEE